MQDDPKPGTTETNVRETETTVTQQPPPPPPPPQTHTTETVRTESGQPVQNPDQLDIQEQPKPKQ